MPDTCFIATLHLATPVALHRLTTLDAILIGELRAPLF